MVSTMRLSIIGLTIVATAGVAQDVNQITLKYDDGTGVSGDLVEFEDGIFRIQSSVGLIAIPAADVACIGSACPEGTELEVAPAPVKLTSQDGSLSVEGNLINFADGQYLVATNIGEMQIQADAVNCEGIGCPEQLEPPSQRVTLVSDAVTIEGDLLSVEEGAYVVLADGIGQVRINADAFECLGEVCP